MKHTLIKYLGAIAVLIASSYFSTVHAAACGTSGGLDTSDITFKGSNADGCGGLFSGNDKLADVNNAANDLLFGGSAWLYDFKDDDPGNDTAFGSASFLGVDWKINVDSGTSGDWALTVTDPAPADLPVAVDFLVVVKSSTFWAAYLFDDESFLSEGVSSGTFQIKITNQKGKFQNISHLSLYAREGEGLTTTTPGSTPMPEPSILLLLGSGIFGIGLVRRRKS